MRDMDFIGGAELTEIPWLRNNQNQITANGSNSPGGLSGTATNANASNAGLVGDLRTESTRVIDGPNGAGSVETVTVNVNGVSSHSPQASTDSNPSNNNNSTPSPSPHGISQGEILRQEQEAGIVPVPSPAHRNGGGRITRSGAAAAAAAHRAVLGDPPSSDAAAAAGGEDDTELDSEPVHARGPDVVGVEDMGPQALGSGLEGGIELEGALGRRGEVGGVESDGLEGLGEGGGEREREREKEKEKDGDGDVVIADADGEVDGKERRDRSGEREEKEMDTVDADGATL